MIDAEARMAPTSDVVDDFMGDPAFVQEELEDRLFPELEERFGGQLGERQEGPLGLEHPLGDEGMNVGMLS